MWRGHHKSGVQPWRTYARLRFGDFLERPVVADDRGAAFRQQPRKQTVAAANFQDAFLVQIAQHLFNGGKMEPSAEGGLFFLICVIRYLVEIRPIAILAREPSYLVSA